MSTGRIQSCVRTECLAETDKFITISWKVQYLPVHLQFLTYRSNILYIWHRNQHKLFSLINKYYKYQIPEKLLFQLISTNGVKSWVCARHSVCIQFWIHPVMSLDTYNWKSLGKLVNFKILPWTNVAVMLLYYILKDSFQNNLCTPWPAHRYIESTGTRVIYWYFTDDKLWTVVSSALEGR